MHVYCSCYYKDSFKMAAAVACTVVAIKDSLKMAAAVACTVVAIIGTVSKWWLQLHVL